MIIYVTKQNVFDDMLSDLTIENKMKCDIYERIIKYS